MTEKIMIFFGILLVVFTIFSIVNDSSVVTECTSKGGTLVRVPYSTIVCAKLEIIK